MVSGGTSEGNVFEVVWIELEDKIWDQALFRQYYDGAYLICADKPERYFEVNISRKEYFKRKLAGTL